MMRPKSLAERLEWMSANLPGFREELDAVDQAERRVLPRSVLLPEDSVAREDQIKFIALTYAEFCLLIEVVITCLDEMKDDDSQSVFSFLPIAFAKNKSRHKPQLVRVMEVTRIAFVTR